MSLPASFFVAQVPEFKPAAAAAFFTAFLEGKDYPSYNPSQGK